MMGGISFNWEEKMSSDEVRDFLKGKIDDLEARILRHTLCSVAAMSSGFVNVDLKSKEIQGLFNELSTLYLEYGMRMVGEEDNDLIIAAVDLNPNLKPGKIVSFADNFHLNLFHDNYQVEGFLVQQGAVSFERSPRQMGDLDIAIGVSRIISMCTAKLNGSISYKAYGETYMKFGEKVIDIATKGWRHVTNTSRDKLDEVILGWTSKGNQIHIDDATYDINGKRLSSSPSYVALYEKDAIKQIVPQDTIKSAAEYLSLTPEQQRVFLMEVYKQVVEDQNGSIYSKLKSKHIATAMTLAYFADKMTAFGLYLEARNMEDAIHQFVKKYKPESTRSYFPSPKLPLKL